MSSHRNCVLLPPHPLRLLPFGFQDVMDEQRIVQELHRLHCEVGLSFEESVGVIADWWEDAADWHSLENEERYVIRGAIRQAIESVESPEYGDVDTLQDYAKRICQAVALAIGSQDFAGHGSYQVSAAERAGFVLIVKEEVQ